MSNVATDIAKELHDFYRDHLVCRERGSLQDVGKVSSKEEKVINLLSKNFIGISIEDTSCVCEICDVFVLEFIEGVRSYTKYSLINSSEGTFRFRKNEVVTNSLPFPVVNRLVNLVSSISNICSKVAYVSINRNTRSGKLKMVIRFENTVNGKTSLEEKEYVYLNGEMQEVN